MQSPKSKSTELPADLALIKELVSTTDYKFLLPAAQNKLLSIKLLTAWFESIQKMLARFDSFPGIYVFLFGTTASLNKGADLQLRTTHVKLEAKTAKLEDAPPVALSDLYALVKEEVRLFGEIKTYEDYGKFVRASSYKAETMGNSDLQHLIAPHLFGPVDTTGLRSTLLSRSQQFKSPEYVETVVLGESTGLSLVTDQRTFVFPPEQRITSMRAVTFHYVRHPYSAECKIHQLLRPHFWRWLTAALTGTDFAHLLTMGWECDHTWVFGRLMEQQNNEREELDQLFAILALQDELRVKSPSENLMAWYVKAMKSINDLNAVTRTYREGSCLMILPLSMAECLYKVHAHNEGYAEVISRVSRENGGYLPLAELQKAIALITIDKNRQKVLSAFNGRAKHEKGGAKQHQIVAAASAKAAGGLDCCYKFLEGKCQDTACTRPHVKVPIPPTVCPKFLADNKSCTGGCGKQHTRWSGVVRLINGVDQTSTDPAKPSKRSIKKAKQVNAAATPGTQALTPPPPSGRGGGKGRGGRDKTPSRGGGKGRARSRAPKSDAICTRCGQPGHELASCWASKHADGHALTCPKPAPVPEKYKKAVTSVQRSQAADDEYDGYESDGLTDAQSINWPDSHLMMEEEAFWPSHHVNMLSSAPRSARDCDTGYVSDGDVPKLVDSSDSDSDGEFEQPEKLLLPIEPPPFPVQWDTGDHVVEEDRPAPTVWCKTAVTSQGLKLEKVKATNQADLSTVPLPRPLTQLLSEGPSVSLTEETKLRQ